MRSEALIHPAHREFSAKTRQNQIEAMERARDLDLLIVGGGINGVWMALDGALRGLKVALVEYEDFGHGPSRNNSELLHGGFRYLKEWYQNPRNWMKVKSVLHLVRDALREREVLMRIAPHLARPLGFCMPLYAPKGLGAATRMFYALGFWMYDKLSSAQIISPHRMLSRQDAMKTLTGVRAEHLVGAGLYYDCKMEPGRFLIEIAKAAASVGALMANYVRANEPIWNAEKKIVEGFHCEDRVSKKTFAVRAKQVIDATGPWGDEFRKAIWPRELPSLRLSKGIHIMVKQLFKEPVACAFFTDDNRILFIIPWGEDYSFSLIGTTDTDYQLGPDEIAPDHASIQYLTEKVRMLFPQADLTMLGNYAGIRPLIRQEGGTASSVSREHTIKKHGEAHVTSVFGGKWTTARVVAGEVLDEVFPESKTRQATQHLRLGGENLAGILQNDRPHADTSLLEAARRLGMEEATINHLIFNYGRNATHVLDLAERDANLQAPILRGMPFIQAEVVYAVRFEMALHVTDFLIRRSIFGRLRQRGLEAAPIVARLMARELGWDAACEKAEAASFEAATRIIDRS